MAQFRKKPIIIEAWQFTEENLENGSLGPPVKAGMVTIYRPHNGVGEVFAEVPTLEGIMTITMGDWIIKGVKGEFYPCKPDIFEMTYERVPPKFED